MSEIYIIFILFIIVFVLLKVLYNIISKNKKNINDLIETLTTNNTKLENKINLLETKNKELTEELNNEKTIIKKMIVNINSNKTIIEELMKKTTDNKNNIQISITKINENMNVVNNLTEKVIFLEDNIESYENSVDLVKTNYEKLVKEVNNNKNSIGESIENNNNKLLKIFNVTDKIVSNLENELVLLKNKINLSEDNIFQTLNDVTTYIEYIKNSKVALTSQSYFCLNEKNIDISGNIFYKNLQLLHQLDTLSIHGSDINFSKVIYKTLQKLYLNVNSIFFESIDFMYNLHSLKSIFFYDGTINKECKFLIQIKQYCNENNIEFKYGNN